MNRRIQTPHVILLPTPRRLLGRWGPTVVGLMSDAPRELFALWWEGP